MADIRDTIIKLLAKASGTENEAEAAVFAAKAQELLAKHNLTQMDLVRRGAEATGQRVGERKVQNKYAGTWRTDLMNATCGFYFCKLLLQRGPDGTAYLVIGKAHNADVATSMFDYLERTVLRLAREWRKQNGEGRKEQLNFEKACGHRLAVRLIEMRKQREAEEAEALRAAAPGTGTALAAYNVEAQAVSAYLSTLKLGKGRAGGGYRTGGAGGMAGHAAAERVSLGGQIAGAAQRRIG